MKRGRSERYIKDEPSLEAYLLDNALSNIEVRRAEGGDVLTETQLRTLLESASNYRRLLDRLAMRQLDERFLDAAAAVGLPTEEDLADPARLEGEVADRLRASMEERDPDPPETSFTVLPDSEHGSNRLVAETRRAGVVLRTTLDTDFVRSADFHRMLELVQEIRGVASPPFEVIVGQNAEAEAEPMPSAIALLQRILDAGSKGLSIQRYKGLGEMNPDQLADTTMDPEQRTLLQVRVEDAVEADEVFTTLMGDEVEPRRDFIERNALNVENLDI